MRYIKELQEQNMRLSESLQEASAMLEEEQKKNRR